MKAMIGLGALVLFSAVFYARPAEASERAYLTSSANLRTGPNADYPRIVSVSSGTRVEVFGCIDDWSWCDIATRGERGWVSASYLDYDNGGRRTRIYGNGASLGLPVLTFVLGTYWDAHYRSRSWYGQRSRWEQHPPQRPRQGAAPRNVNPRAQQGYSPSAPANRASSDGRGGSAPGNRGNAAPSPQASQQPKASGQPQQRGGQPAQKSQDRKQQDQPRR
ncbi:SH3 domain-containing protein [Pseudoxanthomonas sp.]|uniref:SH3 domain-containing protein n=1 Tax=Pseudoxanthomonas sp. TaxID=1871049 RepID=UPI00262C4059|nr:SH3 domain-containing protein [Pseudoxanthomonas sp.]WDS36143.1 MAG: SH3 domain-containing protein [Pseudoxanthomonas sp.]